MLGTVEDAEKTWLLLSILWKKGGEAQAWLGRGGGPWRKVEAEICKEFLCIRGKAWTGVHRSQWEVLENTWMGV